MMSSHFALRLFVAVAIVAAGAASQRSQSVLAAQAASPCALVMVEEIEPLANTIVGEGVPGSLAAAGTSSCRFAWGTGAWRHTLDVIVRDASRVFPGAGPDSIKQGLAASAKPETTDSVIADVGEAAVFKSESPVFAYATAYLKGRILQVRLDGADALEGKAHVVAILKSAAARLQ
jgi:hypothetical protein